MPLPFANTKFISAHHDLRSHNEYAPKRVSSSLRATISQMIRSILHYGHPVLHERSSPVEKITADVEALIDDMIDTMYSASGVGLAAPQVGVSLRLFVADPSGGTTAGELLVMINPEWIDRVGEQREDEGCLSIPGLSSSVLRPQKAVVAGLDRSGSTQEIQGTGILARAFGHEMDHLDGTLFPDHLRGIRRDIMKRKINKLRRSDQW